MGLEYPGGPAISKAALNGDTKAYDLPRPMLNEKNFDFSFSGLKTAVLYTIRNKHLAVENPKVAADLSASTQAAIVEVLVEKTIRAARKLKIKTLIVGGGVAANDALRVCLEARVKKDLPGVALHMPLKKYTTDNAVMIAAAGYFQAFSSSSRTSPLSSSRKRGSRNGGIILPAKIKADPNWELVN
jgi:N6-L-threonylcarbamoyladenine synthase